MEAKEDMNREGHETENNGTKVEELGDNAMHRAPSVDDLFAPLSGLNVHASGQTRQFRAPEAPSVTKHVSSSSSSAGPATHYVSPKSEQGCGGPAEAPLLTSQSSVSSTAESEGGELLKGPEAKAFVPSEDGSKQQGASGSESPGTSGRNSASPPASHFNVTDAADIEPSPLSAQPGGSGGALPVHKLHSGKGGTDAALPSSQSTSDDEQLTGPALDERRQKRMLSNRESARRSRLRKQQHLDELRAQVTTLRTANTDMMARFSIASQRNSQIQIDNAALRAEAAELTRTLQQIHQQMTTQYPNQLRALRIQAGLFDQFPAGDPTSYPHE